MYLLPVMKSSSTSSDKLFSGKIKLFNLLFKVLNHFQQLSSVSDLSIEADFAIGF